MRVAYDNEECLSTCDGHIKPLWVTAVKKLKINKLMH